METTASAKSKMIGVSDNFPVASSEEPSQPSVRASLLEYLQRCIKFLVVESLASQESGGGGMFVTLNDSNWNVSLLCDALERSLMYQLRSPSLLRSFLASSTLSLWPVIAALSQHVQWMREPIAWIQKDINDETERTRAFIRLCLNQKRLADVCSTLAENGELMRRFYDADAILVRADDRDLFITLVRSLSSLDFSLTLNAQDEGKIFTSKGSGSQRRTEVMTTAAAAAVTTSDSRRRVSDDTNAPPVSSGSSNGSFSRAHEASLTVTKKKLRSKRKKAVAFIQEEEEGSVRKEEESRVKVRQSKEEEGDEEKKEKSQTANRLEQNEDQGDEEEGGEKEVEKEEILIKPGEEGDLKTSEEHHFAAQESEAPEVQSQEEEEAVEKELEEPEETSEEGNLQSIDVKEAEEKDEVHEVETSVDEQVEEEKDDVLNADEDVIVEEKVNKETDVDVLDLAQEKPESVELEPVHSSETVGAEVEKGRSEPVEEQRISESQVNDDPQQCSESLETTMDEDIVNPVVAEKQGEGVEENTPIVSDALLKLAEQARTQQKAAEREAQRKKKISNEKKTTTSSSSSSVAGNNKSSFGGPRLQKKKAGGFVFRPGGKK